MGQPPRPVMVLVSAELFHGHPGGRDLAGHVAIEVAVAGDGSPERREPALPASHIRVRGPPMLHKSSRPPRAARGALAQRLRGSSTLHSVYVRSPYRTAARRTELLRNPLVKLDRDRRHRAAAARQRRGGIDAGDGRHDRESKSGRFLPDQRLPRERGPSPSRAAATLDRDRRGPHTRSIMGIDSRVPRRRSRCSPFHASCNDPAADVHGAITLVLDIFSCGPLGVHIRGQRPDHPRRDGACWQWTHALVTDPADLAAEHDANGVPSLTGCQRHAHGWRWPSDRDLSSSRRRADALAPSGLLAYARCMSDFHGGFFVRSLDATVAERIRLALATALRARRIELEGHTVAFAVAPRCPLMHVADVGCSPMASLRGLSPEHSDLGADVARAAGVEAWAITRESIGQRVGCRIRR